MSGIEDPTGGWAKTTEEGLALGNKAIEAARDLGGFLSGPAREVVGMVEDRLKVARYERRVRLLERVEMFMRDRKLSGPTKKLSLSVGLPLLSHAAVEEDNDLQDIWATLLVNATDITFQIEIRRAYVSILADMTSLDAKVISLIAASSGDNRDVVQTCGLPEKIEFYQQGEADYHFPADPSSEVSLSLENLSRLGLVSLDLLWEGGYSTKHARITHLGLGFVKACSGPKITQ